MLAALSQKHMPLAKVMVPVGKDPSGRPVGLQFMSRAGPVGAAGLEYTYSDATLATVDVPFLHNVQTLVDAMVAQDPSLKRVDATLVARDLALDPLGLLYHLKRALAAQAQLRARRPQLVALLQVGHRRGAQLLEHLHATGRRRGEHFHAAS